MKVCLLLHERSAPNLAGAAWRRALGGAAFPLAELDERAGASAGFPYDIALLDVTDDSLESVGSVRRALGENSPTKLVFLIGRPLPHDPAAVEPWRAALGGADLVLATQYSLCLDLRRKTGVEAYELLPPQPREEAPRAALPRKVFAVFAPRGYSHRELVREIGISAYLWLRLRYRLVFADAMGPGPAGSDFISRSAFVYLPQTVEDGGRLAFDCARSGTILIANRDYDPANLLFPHTTFRAGASAWRRALLFLWLDRSKEMPEFMREKARHAAEQLWDENRRVQFFRRVQYRFPKYEYFPRPEAPPSLLDRIRHRSGPEDFPYGAGECAAVCLVRNGREYIPSFLAHHRAVGIRHFAFIDNGSDDGTLELLEGQPDVTVYETSLPHKHYENEIRRLILEKHCRGRFCLNIDVDELFDYPMSDRMGLDGLLDYLRRRGATAMAGYMLDMYRKENAFGDSASLDLKKTYPYYDISNIEKLDYFNEMVAPHCHRNILSASHVKAYFGGIRKTLFGGQYLLTKHPLIFLDGTLDPVTHPHYSNKARVADVTCVLYHYKFTPSFRERVEESRRSRRYVKFAQDQYDRYHARIGGGKALVVDTPGTQRLRGTRELVEQGFLATSPAFVDYVGRYPAPSSALRRSS